MRDYFCSVPGVGAWRWDWTGFRDGAWRLDMIGTQDWTVEGEGPCLGSFLNWGLGWGWVTKLWRQRAFFVNWRWGIGYVGAFGSLVCDI